MDKMNRTFQIYFLFGIFIIFLIMLKMSTPLGQARNHVTYQESNYEQVVSYHESYSDSDDYPERKQEAPLVTAPWHAELTTNSSSNAPESATKLTNNNPTVCKPPLDAPRRGVLIYAPTRSGSTFLGEFFNQHPSVYYLFEPLHSINHTSPNSTAVSKSVLSDLFHCNYSRIPEIYKESVNDVYSNCRSNVCFFTRSKFLWRNTELCKLKHPRCAVKKFSTPVLSKVCRQSLLIGVKAVRFPSLAHLVPMLNSETLNLKVIQLIRDPRAVVPSRIKMAKGSNNLTVSFSKALCDQYIRDWLYFKSCIDDRSPWSLTNDTSSEMCDETTRNLWRHKYMRLSHEYISENPKDAMKKVYEFAGLNIDSDVFAWLKSTTNAKPKEERLFFGTKRNSQHLLKAWRLQQNFSDVEEVQNYCGEIMERYGYISAISKEHLRNVSQKFYSFDKALYLR